MNSMWNEKTYQKKSKYQNTVFFKQELPVIIILGLIYYYVFEKIVLIDLVIITISSMVWIFSTIDIFRQPENIRVPDRYSKQGKTLMFVGIWIIATIILFFVGNHIFDTYV